MQGGADGGRCSVDVWVSACADDGWMEGEVGRFGALFFNWCWLVSEAEGLRGNACRGVVWGAGMMRVIFVSWQVWGESFGVHMRAGVCVDMCVYVRWTVGWMDGWMDITWSFYWNLRFLRCEM